MVLKGVCHREELLQEITVYYVALWNESWTAVLLLELTTPSEVEPSHEGQLFAEDVLKIEEPVLRVVQLHCGQQSDAPVLKTRKDNKTLTWFGSDGVDSCRQADVWYFLGVIFFERQDHKVTLLIDYQSF